MKSALFALSQLLEVACLADVGKYAEELLSYMCSTIGSDPANTVLCVQQVCADVSASAICTFQLCYIWVFLPHVAIYNTGVCLSVCLFVIRMRCARIAEQINVLFWVETSGEPTNILLDGDSGFVAAFAKLLWPLVLFWTNFVRWWYNCCSCWRLYLVQILPANGSLMLPPLLFVRQSAAGLLAVQQPCDWVSILCVLISHTFSWPRPWQTLQWRCILYRLAAQLCRPPAQSTRTLQGTLDAHIVIIDVIKYNGWGQVSLSQKS